MSRKRRKAGDREIKDLIGKGAERVIGNIVNKFASPGVIYSQMK